MKFHEFEEISIDFYRGSCFYCVNFFIIDISVIDGDNSLPLPSLCRASALKAYPLCSLARYHHLQRIVTQSCNFSSLYRFAVHSVALSQFAAIYSLTILKYYIFAFHFRFKWRMCHLIINLPPISLRHLILPFAVPQSRWRETMQALFPVPVLDNISKATKKTH